VLNIKPIIVRACRAALIRVTLNKAFAEWEKNRATIHPGLEQHIGFRLQINTKASHDSNVIRFNPF
jgi:hypothetical protein